MFFKNIEAQITRFQRFKKLQPPEKMWIITHPFILKKVMKVTEETEKITSEMMNDPDLDADHSGGQIDAFRHAFWMANLVQHISPKKAFSLGVAHENANIYQYKKKMLEEKYIPDSTSREMDLSNNQIGIDIGLKNKGKNEEELLQIVKQEIIAGRLRVIKKDKANHFLDKNGNVIPETEYKSKWITPKVLVPSDFKRP